MNINSSTKIVGIFGYPLKHTASPCMHNAAFEALGMNWVYLPFEVEPKRLKDAVESIASLNIKGINVTIPHKREVVPFVDELSSEAQFIGAVNTILNENGKLIGHNTDGEGFIMALREEKISPSGKNILILGAGGASYAIIRQLFLEKVKSIKIANRTLKKAEDLKRHLSKTSSGNVGILPLEASYIKAVIGDIDIVINATSVGMKPTDPLLIEKKWLSPSIKVVIDLIYNPPSTPLLKIAERKEIKAINGFSMLLYQGILSFELWTGRKAPIEVMRKALLEFTKKC